ncbi:MAG: hypothetical protein QNJ46_00285, partial [Leptolyngbyaceae cyanobacterium MO_188.B28]|nr:hypothetical protein [Leptolyngbyaceae cyanobacterium MO_188.B28]
ISQGFISFSILQNIDCHPKKNKSEYRLEAPDSSGKEARAYTTGDSKPELGIEEHRYIGIGTLNMAPPLPKGKKLEDESGSFFNEYHLS